MKKLYIKPVWTDGLQLSIIQRFIQNIARSNQKGLREKNVFNQKRDVNSHVTLRKIAYVLAGICIASEVA